VSLYYLGRYVEAIGCFDNALEIDPQHAFAPTGKKMAVLRKR